MGNLRRKLERDARDLDMKVWFETHQEDTKNRPRRYSEESVKNSKDLGYQMSVINLEL